MAFGAIVRSISVGYWTNINHCYRPLIYYQSSTCYRMVCALLFDKWSFSCLNFEKKKWLVNSWKMSILQQYLDRSKLLMNITTAYVILLLIWSHSVIYHWTDINDDCKFSLLDVQHQLDRHAPVKLEELNHAVSPNGLLKVYLKPENWGTLISSYRKTNN